MSTDEQFVCAISGRSVRGTEDDEDHQGIPVGWATITVAIRTENPAWIEMTEARKSAVEAQLSQVKDVAEREKSRPLANVLARASFAALEQMTPRYLVNEDQVYVSAEEMPELLKFLGQDDE